MSLFVNKPDTDNLPIRFELRAWTVLRLTWSLHSVHCSLLPEQGKSVEVYFISAHSFLDLLCATSSNKDDCDIIYLCKYIQFKFTSRTHKCSLNGTYVLNALWMEHTFFSNWNLGGISCDVHFAGHLRSNRTKAWSDERNIQMCRVGGDWNWELLGQL